MTATPPPGRVTQLFRYPVKSLQGTPETTIRLHETGVAGDRSWGLMDVATGKVASAKRFSALLHGAGSDTLVTLPDGTEIPLDERPDQREAANRALSKWLGREVRVVRAGETGPVSYQMTFEPANDDAEMFDIPTPDGSLVDLAHVHVMVKPTLDWCASR